MNASETGTPQQSMLPLEAQLLSEMSYIRCDVKGIHKSMGNFEKGQEKTAQKIHDLIDTSLNKEHFSILIKERDDRLSALEDDVKSLRSAIESKKLQQAREDGAKELLKSLWRNKTIIWVGVVILVSMLPPIQNWTSLLHH